ncbi:MAG: MFS transporter [Caldilineae bacterium]|nr:MAG: MFS transporter [Caldilineae bacterium]
MLATANRWTRQVLRQLLRADVPVPAYDEAEVAAYQERHYRWNFLINFLDGTFFWIGISFISGSTILPLFVSKLTDSPLPLALLAMVAQSSWYLPQLLTAGPTERLARKKPIVINLGFFTERLPLWLLPVAALLSTRWPAAALMLFFLGYAAHGLGAGIIAPAWSDLVARCFPVRRRGFAMGVTSFAGTGVGALAAVLSGWLLANYPFPVNFALTFLLAALSITISWAVLALIREPVLPVPEDILRPRGRGWRKIRHIIAGDHNFRTYLLVRLLGTFGNMGAGFVTVAAIQRWAVADSTVGLYTAALLVGQTLGNLVAGFVADQKGHKLSLLMGLSGLVLAYLLAWLSPLPELYVLVFFLLGGATGIIIVSGILINMEFSRPEHRPTYIGVANTTVGIGSLTAPLLGGLLALVSYNLLFALTALCALVALVLLTGAVHDPRFQTEYFDAAAG